MMNAKNNLKDRKNQVYLKKHVCERCGVSEILVEFIPERKQRLCPGCLHWLGLSDSKRGSSRPKDESQFKTMKVDAL